MKRTNAKHINNKKKQISKRKRMQEWQFARKTVIMENIMSKRNIADDKFLENLSRIYLNSQSLWYWTRKSWIRTEEFQWKYYIKAISNKYGLWEEENEREKCKICYIAFVRYLKDTGSLRRLLSLRLHWRITKHLVSPCKKLVNIMIKFSRHSILK